MYVKIIQWIVCKNVLFFMTSILKDAGNVALIEDVGLKLRELWNNGMGKEKEAALGPSV